MAYDSQQIARELMDTSLGSAYHGNALYVAKGIAILSDEDRSILDKWLTGKNVAADGWALQQISMKVAGNA